ncbi:hypothetical protein [Algiphilus sp.]|uniref:sensor histidine kinase n=2 Tax=Algiphilus sp. TaxID=1872431 RepID=UPI0025C408D2|nr:hypothetical protein [Algiphilus sp.]MCK5769027.1 hypothetical protein [Algiphilus sp.]
MPEIFRPQTVISTSVLLAALLVAVAIALATRQPGLGITLLAPDQGPGLQVDGITRHPGLSDGDRLVALLAPDGGTIPLGAEDLSPEPDARFARYSAMDAFFARQSAIAALMRTDTLRVRLADGRRVALHMTDHRPVADLPFIFWFQLICAVGGLLGGASVLAFRWRDPAARYFALTGVGLSLAATAASIYSSRELAIDGDLFRALSATNQSGSLLFCGCFIAAMWHYPRRLGRAPLGSIAVALYMALAASVWLRLQDDVHLVMHGPILAGYLVTCVLGALQWRRARGDAYDRAALSAFLSAWLLGSGLFLMVSLVPVLFGIDTGATQAYTFGFFLFIYAGVALAIARYRLFELDRWWFGAWVVFLGGSALIVLDLLLIQLLRFDDSTALLVSLALAGWLYMPIRQWLMTRLQKQRRDVTPAALIAKVTDALSGRERDPVATWTHLLHDMFRPLAIERVPEANGSADTIQESGLSMLVARHGQLPALRMRYCGGGERLFRRSDLRVIGDLRRLFDEVLTYRGQIEDGIARERERVARDLHDDVGARLLTMSHRLPGEHADGAREALAMLRDVVHSMRAPACLLEELLGDWRAEAAERCDAAGTDLAWNAPESLPDVRVDGATALALSRVLREVLSNALRHSAPDRIELAIGLTDDGALAVACRHAYSGVPPETWTESLGLSNLRQRIGRLDGRVWWAADGASLVTRWQVPLRGGRAPASPVDGVAATGAGAETVALVATEPRDMQGT